MGKGLQETLALWSPTLWAATPYSSLSFTFLVYEPEDGKGTPMSRREIHSPHPGLPSPYILCPSVGASSISFCTSFIIGEGNGNPLQCSCLENPRDRGACWGAVSGVAESDTTEAT